MELSYEKDLIEMQQKWQMLEEKLSRTDHAVDEAHSDNEQLRRRLKDTDIMNAKLDSFINSLKWVIGIMILVGGSTGGICWTAASEARDSAVLAYNKAASVSVVEAKISNIQEDMRDMKLVMNGFSDLEVHLARIAGTIDLISERVNNLQSVN